MANWKKYAEIQLPLGQGQLIVAEQQTEKKLDSYE